MRRATSFGLRSAAAFDAKTLVSQPAYRNEVVLLSSRNYANLKELRLRLGAIKNIKKITSTMKMIAAAKVNKAQQALYKVRPYGVSSQRFVNEFYPVPEEGAEVTVPADKKHLVIGVTSDRGLCGGVNSTIIKACRAIVNESPQNTKLFLFGEKSRAALQREYANNIVAVISEVGGNKKLTYADVAQTVELIAKQDFDTATVMFNRFGSVMSFITTKRPFPSPTTFGDADKYSAYEFEGNHEEVLADFWQYTLANYLFTAITESQTAELATRMTSMDNATKNASDVLSKLTIKYNRTRQAAITTELTEIVSGAAAIEEQSA